MGKQDEERVRLGPLCSWMLLLRTVHDTGCGAVDSSQVLPGTLLSRFKLSILFSLIYFIRVLIFRSLTHDNTFVSCICAVITILITQN